MAYAQFLYIYTLIANIAFTFKCTHVRVRIVPFVIIGHAENLGLSTCKQKVILEIFSYS